MSEFYDEAVVKAIESCATAQAMIDINAQHLEGLRTECAITQELTQMEIRTLEVSKKCISTHCIVVVVVAEQVG